MDQASPFGVPLECAIYGTPNASDSESTIHYSLGHMQDRATQVTILVLLGAGAACVRETVNSDHSLSFAAACGPLDPSGPFAKMLERGMFLRSDAIHLLSRKSYEDKQSFFESVDAVKDNPNISPEVRIRLLDFAHANKLTTSVSMPLQNSMTENTFFEAFRYAVKFDQVSILEKLVVDSRFSVNQAWVGPHPTPLHFSAKYHSVQVLHMLLDLGYDPTVPGELGETVLHDVIHFGIDDDALLRRLISTEATGVLDKKGRTVWHEAACEGSLQSLRILFDIHGPHTPLLHQPCKNGYTPILDAILGQYSECALLILS